MEKVGAGPVTNLGWKLKNAALTWYRFSWKTVLRFWIQRIYFFSTSSCRKADEPSILSQSVGATEYTESPQKGRLLPTSILIYDTKQSDVDGSVKLQPWGMQSPPLLLSIPGPLKPGVVAPDGVLFMGQIKLIFTLCTYTKLHCLKWNFSIT